MNNVYDLSMFTVTSNSVLNISDSVFKENFSYDQGSCVKGGY
jgi:hypothetical protein